MPLKKIFIFVTVLVLVLILSACQKGAMEEQTGSGTDTSDSEYTEFAAKKAAEATLKENEEGKKAAEQQEQAPQQEGEAEAPDTEKDPK